MRREDESHRRLAEAAARRTLEQRWTRDRFELELVRETEPRFSHIYLRVHHAAFFTIHERVGTALVTTGERGTRIKMGARLEPERPIEAAPPEVLEQARAIADAHLRRAGFSEKLVARVTAVHAAPRSSGASAGWEVLVSGFAPAPEGPIHVEIDADSGELLSWFAPVFLRGSRDGGALGRAEAERRAAREETLPEGATLARADLEETPGGRFWRLRFDVANGQERGHIVVTVHARTGAVVGCVRLLVATGDLGPRTARERAEAVVAHALPELIGPDAELKALIPGAVLRLGKRRAGWIGTAKLADGAVVRVAYADDEVEVALGGQAVKTRVDFPAPAEERATA